MTDDLSVSLVMTVLNEERGLRTFLDSLRAQTTPPAEVVIVDGGSTDATVTLLEQWADSTPYPVKVLRSPGANISQGRNTAIEAATHDLVAVTDAGTTLDPRWLDRLLSAVEPGGDVVAGFFEPCWTTRRERLFASVTVPTRDEIDAATFLPSSRSLLVSRAAWRAAGGYPEWLDYCEDLVFDLAMREAGMVFRLAPDAIARWPARPTWRAYAKQYYRYARGDGKAGLWRSRHALRYGAYAVGAAGLIAGPWWARTALALGFAGYLRTFVGRAWRRRPQDRAHLAAMLIQVPAVVVVGDLAKMAGYPVGVLWRLRRRARRRAG